MQRAMCEQSAKYAIAEMNAFNKAFAARHRPQKPDTSAQKPALAKARVKDEDASDDDASPEKAARLSGTSKDDF
jgi:hypothetical protein